MESLKEEWKEFNKTKMICPPFLMPTQINRIINANAMPDSGCNTYGLIDSHFVQRNKLQRIPIEKRKVFAYDNRPGEQLRQWSNWRLT